MILTEKFGIELVEKAEAEQSNLSKKDILWRGKIFSSRSV